MTRLIDCPDCRAEMVDELKLACADCITILDAVVDEQPAGRCRDCGLRYNSAVEALLLQAYVCTDCGTTLYDPP